MENSSSNTGPLRVYPVESIPFNGWRLRVVTVLFFNYLKVRYRWFIVVWRFIKSQGITIRSRWTPQKAAAPLSFVVRFLGDIGMEFFSGFKWAVPKAFSDAVALCRFEEGDILYDTEKAYIDNWEKACKFIEHSLQVRYPARVGGGASEKGGGVFSGNWGSEVRIDLYKNQDKVGVGQITTTQGRLYTALWKGDISILKKESEEPPIPLTVQDVTKTLDQATQKAKGNYSAEKLKKK